MKMNGNHLECKYWPVDLPGVKERIEKGRKSQEELFKIKVSFIGLLVVGRLPA